MKNKKSSQTINISVIFKKCLSTLLPATWFQLNGMIFISKTIDFGSPADRMQTKILKANDFLHFALNFSVILSCHTNHQIRTANQICCSYKNDQSIIFVTVYWVT